MKKPLKIALIVTASLALLVVIGVVVVFQRIDAIVESTIEREGTAQLDLATELADADVSVFGGRVSLNRLTIDNPPGFEADHLFELGQVSVAVNYGDLTNEPVRISSIDINSPVLVLERAGGGDLGEQLRLNLQDLLDRLETEDTTDDGSAPTKLLIDRLTVTGATVVVRLNPAELAAATGLTDLAKLDDVYSVTIPDVTLNEIGTADGAQNGAEIGRVVTEVATVLARRALESQDLPPELRAVLQGDLRAVLAQYGDKLAGKVRDELDRGLDELADELGSAGGAAVDKLLQGDRDGALEDAGDALQEEGRRQLERGLGNLLGGDED
jgi:hypothetical protein